MKHITSFSLCIILLLFCMNSLSLISISETNEEIQTKQIYSESSDGFTKFLGTPQVHSWEEVRNNESGNQVYSNWTKYLKGALAAYNGKEGDMYVVSRSFFTFNTTIHANVSEIKNVSLFLFSCGANESSVCVVDWTDGPDGLDLDDYSQVGSTSFGRSQKWVLNTYNEIPLNNNGINAINMSGLTYLACREYDHDFLNVQPEDERLAEYRNGHYFSEELGTNRDPYLLITYISDGEENGSIPTSTPSLSLGIFLICAILISYKLIRKREN